MAESSKLRKELQLLQECKEVRIGEERCGPWPFLGWFLGCSSEPSDDLFSHETLFFQGDGPVLNFRPHIWFCDEVGALLRFLECFSPDAKWCQGLKKRNRFGAGSSAPSHATFSADILHLSFRIFRHTAGARSPSKPNTSARHGSPGSPSKESFAELAPPLCYHTLNLGFASVRVQKRLSTHGFWTIIVVTNNFCY